MPTKIFELCNWLNQVCNSNLIFNFILVSSVTYPFLPEIKNAFSKANIAALPKHITIYTFAGDKDAVGLQGKGFSQIIKNWRAAGVTDITYKLYPGGRHEMMNDTIRPEVLGDIVVWLSRYI